jgi:hypothetical protein
MPGRFMGGSVFLPGSKGAGRCPAVDTHAFTPVVNSYQPLVPAGADFLTHQAVRHRVESPGYLHVPVRMDDAAARFKEAEALFWQGPKRRFLHLQEVGIHLLASRPVDTYPGYSAVPALEEAVQFLQAIEAPPFKGIAFEIAVATLVDSLFLGMARSTNN